ncbi:MAG: hypothetical protein E7505_04560 [Ruminococcus sp.]|nr:hypothetical protein [Ruminococcus sp.]
MNKDEIRKKVIQELNFVHSTTDKQRALIMDYGYYNDAIKGYLIAAARAADLDDHIDDMLDALSDCLDHIDHDTAVKVYKKY